ncbi:unknown [Firmicutes bacterium CAG:791]|nr:unknown [Firmicutes bacterium CAG:791]
MSFLTICLEKPPVFGGNPSPEEMIQRKLNKEVLLYYADCNFRYFYRNCSGCNLTRDCHSGNDDHDEEAF